MFLRFTALVFAVFLVLAPAALAQDSNAGKTEKKDDKKKNSDNRATVVENATAEQVAESAIVIYGGLLGRQNLSQIRKTAFERGKTVTIDPQGQRTTATYERFVVRGETMLKEKIRIDQAFPDTRFSLVYNEDRIYAVYNDSVFTPREDASRAFQDQIWHSIESLLRYKENESKLELAKREKIMGVDFFVVDLTDKTGRKTRYFVSVKSLRVMMLEYQSGGVQYRRKFYDYNYAQGTLVPYRSVLWAGEREVEENEIGTITFGQKIEDTLFVNAAA